MTTRATIRVSENAKCTKQKERIILTIQKFPTVQTWQGYEGSWTHHGSVTPFDQRSLIHREAWFPPCFVRQNPQQQKKLFFVRRF